MRIAIALLVVCLLPRLACAGFADFSDFPQSQSFAVGEVFQSGDLLFKAQNWHPTGTPVKVFVTSMSSILNPGPGVEFILPSGIQEVDLAYDDGAGVNFIINGVLAPDTNRAGFSFLNGTSLGGVSIYTDVTFDGGSHEVGTLRLRGPINSFEFAGLELFIDDITVRVPEPSAVASLLPIAAVGMIARRRFLAR